MTYNDKNFEIHEFWNGEFAYRNKQTREISDQHFLDARTVKDGWGEVKLKNGNWTFFNPSTQKFSKQEFKNIAYYIDKWLAVVQLNDKQWGLYYVEEDKLFSARFEKSEDIIDVCDALKQNPLDFKILPTYLFLNPVVIKKYLKTISLYVREHFKNSKEFDEKYMEIKNTLVKKLKYEKSQIRQNLSSKLDDEAKIDRYQNEIEDLDLIV